MTTVPQTERETIDEELSIFPRASYVQALENLSWRELKEECLKQYDLSGLSLDKYRAEYQKKEDARRKNVELYSEISRLAHDLDYAERAIKTVVFAIEVTKENLSIATEYTHAMKRTVATIITDSLNKACRDLDTVLYRRSKRHEESNNTPDEIPF